MKTFFAFIKQLNSLFLFGILTSVILLVAYGVWSGIKEQNKAAHPKTVLSVSDASGSKVELRFRIEDAKDIPGANTQMLKLVANKKKAGLVYSDYESDARNMLFLTGDERRARWLFAHQNNVIRTAGQLQMKVDEENPAGKVNPTKALYFLYADKDTSGDGEITSDDRANLGLAQANGEGFVTVLTGIDRLYSASMLGDQTISVLYQTGKVIRHALYSVATLAKVADREVAAIPGVEYLD
jgi:hypothetical protein